MPSRPVSEWDVVVVGGGPAGSACAAFLARGGWNVLLAERAPSPRAKVCGEFICPQAFEILEDLGARRAVEEEPHQDVTGMVLAAPDGKRIETEFPVYRGRAGHRRYGVSMRRPRFDALLQENASRLGACFWPGTRLSGLRVEPGGAALTFQPAGDAPPVSVRARLVIGADGRFSAVARRAGLAVPASGRIRAVLHGYYEGVSGLARKGEMHIFAGGSYCALDPLPDGTCNVSYVDDLSAVAPWRHRGNARLREVFRESPHLREMFAGARPLGEARLLAPLRVRSRRPFADRVMLVGDAAGFYDPFTGEGIYAALKTASMAARVAGEALDGGDCSARELSRYGRLRARWIRPKMWVWNLFQELIRREGLVNRFGSQLVRRPELANLLVGLTGNYIPPAALLRPSVLGQILKGLLPDPRPLPPPLLEAPHGGASGGRDSPSGRRVP